MSRRTAEANKAIRLAWEREQKLVQEGKGTRDWTPEQQSDILDPDKGKAYDDKGRAFEGQHMKSVAEHPEHQGNPDNIQFLTKEEHLEAHKGSWQNPTNWYYNPETKEYIEFGDTEILPCKIIDLSDPIIRFKTGDASSNREDSDLVGAKESKTEEKPIPQVIKKETTADRVVKPVSTVASQTKGEQVSFFAKAWKGIKTAASVAAEYVKNNPEKVIGGIVTTVGIIAKAVASSNNSSRSNDSYSHDSYSNDNHSNDYLERRSEDSNTSASQRDYPDVRSSPREHDVSGYDRQQNGRTVHVNPYKRGGNKDN